MKTVDILRQILIANAHTPAHITPALEGLCGIIDRQNRRIDELEKKVKK